MSSPDAQPPAESDEPSAAPAFLAALESPQSTSADLAARMRLCGIEPGQACVVVVAASPDDADLATKVLTGTMRRANPGAVVGQLDDLAVAVVPVDAKTAAEMADTIRARLQELEPSLGEIRLHIGVSDAVDAGASLPGALAEARQGLLLAADAAEATAVIASDELDTHLLLLSGVPGELRQSYRVRVLGPLLRYDAVHRTELVTTLDAFLRNSGSWVKAAEELHLHVNTLRYRIERVERLTGRELSRLEDRIDLFLALQIGSPN